MDVYTRDEALTELIISYGYPEDRAPHILDRVQEGMVQFVEGYIPLRFDKNSGLFIIG